MFQVTPYCASLLRILDLQPLDMAALLVVNVIEIVSNNLHENVVCYTAVFSVVTQALRDDSKNSCVAD